MYDRLVRLARDVLKEYITLVLFLMKMRLEMTKSFGRSSGCMPIPKNNPYC